MNRALILGLAGVLSAVAADAARSAEQGKATPGAGTAATSRSKQPPAGVDHGYPAMPWYGTRRYSGYYAYRPRFGYERLVEHGAYSTSNTRYGFPLGIALAGGFADVAAYPVGNGNPYAYRSPWYWNPMNAGASATSPNPYPFQYPYAYPYPVPYGGYLPRYGGYGPYPPAPPYGAPSGGWNWYGPPAGYPSGYAAPPPAAGGNAGYW
jgi:hypothetical protein